MMFMMRGVSAFAAFVLMGLISAALTNVAAVIHAQEAATKFREWTFVNVPEPSAVLGYYAAGATVLLVIVLIANGVLRHSRYR